MRIQITEEMETIYETILPYMIYTKDKGCCPRPDSPQKIFDLYRRYCEEMERLRGEWRKGNW